MIPIVQNKDKIWWSSFLLFITHFLLLKGYHKKILTLRSFLGISGNKQNKIFKNHKIYDYNIPNLNFWEFLRVPKYQFLIFQKSIFFGRKTNFFVVRERKYVFLAKRLLSNLNRWLRGVLYFLVVGELS